MNNAFQIIHLSKELKKLILVFLFVLTVGFSTALIFINTTTESSPKGIIENYNGNEQDEESDIMKFRKSEHEMLNIVHTHILSMSIIFLILGFLMSGVQMNKSLKTFLIIEPLFSVLLTFGGILLIWKGFEFFTYLVMLSGFLMTISFYLSVLFIGRECLKKA